MMGDVYCDNVAYAPFAGLKKMAEPLREKFE